MYFFTLVCMHVYMHVCKRNFDEKDRVQELSMDFICLSCIFVSKAFALSHNTVMLDHGHSHGQDI
jgi:hypothetical protein